MVADPVFLAKDRVPNRFMLCVVAFERSKQLIKGARPRTDRKYHSLVTLALGEIADERVVLGDAPHKWKLG